VICSKSLGGIVSACAGWQDMTQAATSKKMQSEDSVSVQLQSGFKHSSVASVAEVSQRLATV
jgi:hypothetical protein